MVQIGPKILLEGLGLVCRPIIAASLILGVSNFKRHSWKTVSHGVARAGNTLAVSGDPRFHRLLGDLKVRAIREVPNDSDSVRNLFDRIRQSPFPSELGPRDLAEMARHLMPGPDDTHAISNTSALGVLERRLPANLLAEPFITQLALVVSDPTWKPTPVVVRRMIVLLENSNTADTMFDGDRTSLTNLCRFSTTQFLDGRISIIQLGAIFQIAVPFVMAVLRNGEGHPDFLDLRTRVEASVGTPPLVELPNNQFRFSSVLGTLAVLTGLHVEKCRDWVGDVVRVAKEAETGATAREKFVALWEFVRESFTTCGYDLEIATTLLAEAPHFDRTGRVWPIMDSFCDRVDDPDATKLD